MSLINWETTSKLKELGGWGIYNIHFFCKGFSNKRGMETSLQERIMATITLQKTHSSSLHRGLDEKYK
jgi:hypothetical protein